MLTNSIWALLFIVQTAIYSYTIHCMNREYISFKLLKTIKLMMTTIKFTYTSKMSSRFFTFCIPAADIFSRLTSPFFCELGTQSSINGPNNCRLYDYSALLVERSYIQSFYAWNSSCLMYLYQMRFQIATSIKLFLTQGTAERVLSCMNTSVTVEAALVAKFYDRTHIHGGDQAL